MAEYLSWQEGAELTDFTANLSKDRNARNISDVAWKLATIAN